MDPLHRLAERTGETAYLARWADGDIRALACVRGGNAVQVAEVEPGPYRHAHARTTGKLLLGFARPEDRRAYLAAHPPEPVTPRTLTDPAALAAELAAIRERGYAEDFEEYRDFVACVSAPLWDCVIVAAYTVRVLGREADAAAVGHPQRDRQLELAAGHLGAPALRRAAPAGRHGPGDCTRAEGVLMDEPLSNLDARLRVEMRAEISRIQREVGAATIYVTHDQVEARTMGDRVAVLRKGRPQQVDDPQLLFDEPANLFVEPANLFVASFIGSPQMNLLQAVVERDGDRLGLQLGERRVPLAHEPPARRAGLAGYAGRPIAIGIRPECTAAPADGDELRLEGTLVVSEPLGAESLVHMELPVQPVNTEEVREVARDTEWDPARSRPRHSWSCRRAGTSSRGLGGRRARRRRGRGGPHLPRLRARGRRPAGRRDIAGAGGDRRRRPAGGRAALPARRARRGARDAGPARHPPRAAGRPGGQGRGRTRGRAGGDHHHRRRTGGGATELELWTETRAAMERRAGSRLPVPADFVTGERTADVGGPPTARALGDGDLLLVDLVPRLGAYWADSCPTVAPRRAAGRGEGRARGGALRARVGQGGDPAGRAGRRRRSRGPRPDGSARRLPAPHRAQPRGDGPRSAADHSRLGRRLAEGMVLALEPGTYGDGWGVRVEQVVVATSDGCEVLSAHDLAL